MTNKLFSPFLRLPRFPQLFLIITVISALMLASCKKKTPGDPPTLPPAETMQIDFSNFILASRSANAKGVTSFNWEKAVEIVSSWRTFAADIPVTAYKGVAGQKASHISGAKWEWSQSSNRLTGETAGSQVKWEMYVSNAKRLDGTSNIAGTEGKWTLYEGQTAVLQIDYTNSGGKITYTYQKEGNNKGAFIEFGSASGAYNFYYTVRYYNAGLNKFSEANIEWNNATKAGRIRSADYLNGAWQQWDGQKMDL